MYSQTAPLEIDDRLFQYVRSCGWPIYLEEAVCAYLSGQTTATAAFRHGLPQQRLEAVLRGYGLMRHRADQARLAAHKGRVTDPQFRRHQQAEIADLYMQGCPEAELARRFDLSRSTVRSRLQSAGIRELKRIHTLEHRCRVANTRQQRQTHVGEGERMLSRLLRDRGIEAIPQQAVGPYNVDLGAYPIAIEVISSRWHTGRDLTERFRYMFGEGWSVLVIVARRTHWSRSISPWAVDYAAGYLEERRYAYGDTPGYRIIRGAGEEIARGGPSSDELVHMLALGNCRLCRLFLH